MTRPVTATARLLVVADDPMIRTALEKSLAHMGHRVDVAGSLDQGLRALGRESYDLVLLDVHLPDGNGMQAVPRFRAVCSEPEVVLVTGLEDPQGAELALFCDAWDYVRKPLNLPELQLTVRRALQFRHGRQTRRRTMALDRCGLVGASPAFISALDRLAEAAAGDMPVLLAGGVGTGKNGFIHALHANSARHGGPLVTVACGDIPADGAERILFGSAGDADSVDGGGLFGRARGGTLFLDGVESLEPAVQSLVLRACRERRFRPAGSSENEACDFRLAAATGHDLEALVREGRFRAKLLYLLRGLSIELPPLVERPGDVALLAHHFQTAWTQRANQPVRPMSSSFLQALQALPWPGNVRELRDALEHALDAARHDAFLLPAHLPAALHDQVVQAGLEASMSRHPAGSDSEEAPADILPFGEMRRRAQAQAEREYLLLVAARCRGDLARARKLTGLSRSRLYELLQKHGLTLNG